jgi:hypothetical protein
LQRSNPQTRTQPSHQPGLSAIPQNQKIKTFQTAKNRRVKPKRLPSSSFRRFDWSAEPNRTTPEKQETFAPVFPAEPRKLPSPGPQRPARFRARRRYTQQPPSPQQPFGESRELSQRPPVKGQGYAVDQPCQRQPNPEPRQMATCQSHQPSERLTRSRGSALTPEETSTLCVTPRAPRWRRRSDVCVRNRPSRSTPTPYEPTVFAPRSRPSLNETAVFAGVLAHTFGACQGIANRRQTSRLTNGASDPLGWHSRPARPALDTAGHHAAISGHRGPN